MGGFLSHPVTVKQSDHGEGLGLRYAFSSMQGWRLEMEDAHDTKIGLSYGLDDWSFFAVFDGHAGKHTAAYASINLLDHILKNRKFKLIPDETKISNKDSMKEKLDDTTICSKSSEDSPNEPSDPSSTPLVITDIENTKDVYNFIGSDAQFSSFPVSKQLIMVKDAIKSGFLSMDKVMRADRKDMSGSTAICAFISPTHLFIANCGDSRAVLFDGISPKFATEDHKPFNPGERRRIIKAGGIATERVNGSLAVSRSLGDFEFKMDKFRGSCEQLISPEPEITLIPRQSTDQFLILACDGIWDVMTNQDLCQYVNYMLKLGSDLETVCSSVLDVCLRKGSKDNMSIIIVVFQDGPKIDPKTINQTKENDKALLDIFDSIHNQHPIRGLSTVIRIMEDEMKAQEIYNDLAPPGAGLFAKYDLFRDIYERKLKLPKFKDSEDKETNFY